MKNVLVLLLAALAITGCASVPVVHQRPGAVTFDIRVATNDLIGKTPAAVAQALGRPDREHGDGHREWWMYEERFYDSVTGKTLPIVTVVYQDGKVVAVTF